MGSNKTCNAASKEMRMYILVNGYPKGHKMLVHSLKTQPELNGLIASVEQPIKKIEPTGKTVVGYIMRFPGGLFHDGQVHPLKLKNLTPCEEAAATAF